VTSTQDEETMKPNLATPLCLLFVLYAWITPSGAQSSAQDMDLAVDPVIRVFPVTALNTDSAEVRFRITNHNASESRALGVPSLDGPNADQFLLVNDSCNGASLLPNQSCTVGVKFHPTSQGSKAANLLFASDDTETPTLTAFVTNSEATASEATRRIPPVLTALNLPTTMVPGQTYSLTWSLEGYHSDYSSNMVLFDCTGAAADCGANYGDVTRLVESGNLECDSVTAGSWQFGDVVDQRFNYVWTFTVPATRLGGDPWPAGGTDIVVRFYCKDDVDQARNGRSVSLMVPGKLAGSYYDTTGRRIVTQIKP